ncbi:MAG: glycine--tRNA ligase [Oligoflexia bacterium]|nr:glycine--tRNA ligase [Oligoflexia bacterium]
MADSELLNKVVSLCKRRGFIFQSSEIYGGLKSAYDYGPLGVELKRNIAAEWWKAMVHEREDIVGMDASIFMHPNVWKSSGHLACFSDPLVDCLNCKERFRADKAPKAAAGTQVEFREGGRKDGRTLKAEVAQRGYVCPNCGGPRLSDERQFNMMFRTSIGPVDALESFIDEVEGKALGRQELREKIEAALAPSAIYLRPETAQGMFVQFLNVQQSTSMKVPFGIAQQGKAFRNEIVTEKFIFRTCEFEQMEMEYFVEPGSESEWHDYWVKTRLAWWKHFANNKEGFRARFYEKSELAHYASACADIEFQYPWGWDELEGIASRTNYDLTRHGEESGAKLSYFDQQKPDPATGKMGWRYIPYVIEPASGLTRAVLMYLCDAYAEEQGTDAEGEGKTRVILKLNPRLAPIKVAVLPLMKKEGLPEVARGIVQQFFKSGINASYDEQQSIGKRYARHDEVGTPYCLTVDHQTLQDQTVTIRDRDTTKQERISVEAALGSVTRRIAEA